MYHVNNILKNTNYPDWILSHPIFKDITVYDKIFPKKGLTNSSSPLTTIMSENFLKEFFLDIIDSNNHTIKILDKGSDTSFVQAARSFFTKFTTPDYLEVVKENKISIYLSENITDNSGKIVFKKGSSLFSLLERVTDLKDGIKDFFQFESFKDFSRLNIPLSSAEICFSTDPWDIATMSMRGIATCQSWEGEYRQAIIGSMLDPYVGIIYLATKSRPTEHGSKMLFRATVRFAVDNREQFKKKQPVLIVDHVYPEQYDEVLKVFSNYLTEKSGLQVLYAPHIQDDITDGLYLLPRSKIKDSFIFYSEEDKSEQPFSSEDSIRSYQNITIKDKPEKVSKTDKSIKSGIKRKFIDCLIANTSPSGIDLSDFGSSKINTLLAIKNKNLFFKDQIRTSIRTFCNVLSKQLDLDDDLDESSYRVKLYLNYFHKRNHLLESISGQVTEWNGSFSLKKSAAFSRKDFVLIMQQAMRQADKVLKAELKGFFAARRA